MDEMEKEILSICEAVWRLGRGTALDLPLDPELTPEDAADFQKVAERKA